MNDSNVHMVICHKIPLEFGCDFGVMSHLHKSPNDCHDHPLYWKALTIIQSLPIESTLNLVTLRHESFHMKISFLGTIINHQSQRKPKKRTGYGA